ncbi:MAG: hypothetical protein ACLUC0_19450 [Clostridium neonatale]|uniref:hypothetical protein n=1 Tax=Clostridium neonatale TaxID=137838 RepID=UPI00291BFCE1|nr:FtsK domain-containing protein [Clostridium neonatale]
MMKGSSSILLGYDFDKWYGYGAKEAITTDISTKTNSHTLICGMSGSGKSFLTNIVFARLCLENGTGGQVYFADFKQDDQFSHLRNCPRYYPYDKTLEALDTVYEILHNRQSGEDVSRHPITLIWDEYVANVLALQGIDKKKADVVMRRVSEILMLGRSLSVRIIISCQRPDASVFPTGSRLNYGVIIIVGAPIRSIYEMLIPKEYIDRIGGREFGVGEGVVLLQGSQLEFIKIPLVRDLEKMQQICIYALTK